MFSPQLRFADENGLPYPDWSEKTLGEIATRVKRKNIEDNQNVLTISAQQGLVNQQQYFTKSVSAKDVKGYYLLEKNDFAYNRSYSNGYPMGAIKRLKLYPKGVVSTLYICFKLDKLNDEVFFEQYFESGRQNREIEGVAQEGARNHGLLNVGLEDFFGIRISLPSLPEQKKIASFLGAVDEKIYILTEKHQALCSYKNGWMQKIFNRELNFKNDIGGNFPTWKKTQLGSICLKISAGATPSTTKKEYWNGNIRWMNSGELNLKRVYEVSNRITELGLNNSSTKIIPKESVLIGLAGQGKTRGTVAINYVELCTNQSIAAIQPNPDKFIPEFIYQNLNSRYQEIRSMSTGDGGRGGLNLEIIKSIPLNLPSLPEQMKIASFLYKIDEKIANVQEQLELTKQYKQGLLQQMFV